MNENKSTAPKRGTHAPDAVAEASPILGTVESVTERTMNGLAILFPGIPAEELLNRVAEPVRRMQRLQELFPTAPPEALTYEVETLQRELQRDRASRGCGCGRQAESIGVIKLPGGERLVVAQIQAYKPRGNDTIIFVVDGHEEICTLPSVTGKDVKAQREELLRRMDLVMSEATRGAVDIADDL